MQMMIHALRCTIIDFCDDFDLDNNGEYVSEKAAICKLFSIDTVRLVSDEMLEIFGGDGYFEDSPYGPTELLYRDCRAMWLEEGAPTVQRITIAKGIERSRRYVSSTRPGSLALSSTSSDSFNQEMILARFRERGSICFPFFC